MNQLPHKKILLIEDNADIRFLVTRLLKKQNFEVIGAADGRLAIEALNNNPEIDLILLDLMMPVMDGYEFRTEQLKNTNWAELPVIVMSADVASTEILKKLRLNHFVKKPINLEEFLPMVKSLTS